ncbi:SusC/RagA family TonB-linked outer membrane protein [Parabacteroides sp.]|uniref:SusC/RagA family TonB-linked outer membrane protein n=1 Tax=Parabacteroides sp. TaxID=1869337 RepID=UPI0025800792|nr:SusC/RagA family TonB-linked outer membrane protein [Parabacteroides sp.]
MLKNFKPVSLVLIVGALSFSGNIYANLTPEKANPTISQQTGKVTGTVEDDFGPVAGASVVVKGTTNGTITDMNGNFTLESVKNGDVIQISFIGYSTQEITFTGQPLSVKLAEDTQKLDEVVVTALGMKRTEKALGYAVTELKGDELKTNAINPVASLQGKVAGVEIASSDGGMFGATKIQIRGASTLSGNNQPIYVVDGVILSNDLSGTGSSDWDSNANDYGNMLKNLNPDDFETVSVLKGAAATALYGSRGLNGAVVITTKSGKGATGFGLSVSQTFGLDHAHGGMNRQTIYGPGNYSGNVTYGEQDASGNYKKWDNLNQFFLNKNGDPTVIGLTSRLWGPKYDGRMIEDYDGRMIPYSPFENNMSDAYQLGLNSNTNVSLRGGNETTNFYSSISYKKARGVVENNDFERYSLLLKAAHKVSDRVNVNASISFANSTPKNAQRNIGESFATGTYSTLYDTKYYRDKYLGDHGGLASTNYGDKYGSVPGKGLWFEIDNYSKVRKETVVRPTVEINVNLLKWLDFRAEGNMNYYYTSWEDKQLGSGYANEGGFYEMGQDYTRQSTFAGTFTVNKDVSDFHIGGFLRGEYYVTSSGHQLSKTDGGLVVPGQYFIGNSKNTYKTEASIKDTKRILSVVAAANLSWRNQIFLDITGRNDWSSGLIYTNGSGNYSYFYPSIGGSVLFNEIFKDDMPEWINLAKLRASWAQVGNDASAYSIYSYYSLGSLLQANGSNIFTNGWDDSQRKLFSPNLKPERKNSWEIGLDFRTFNSRLCLDATYYKENTTDQIMTIAIPSESGVNQQLINAGNIQNSGVEIALNTIPFTNKDWEWTLDFTFTKNSNKIVELHPNVANYIALEGDVAYGNYRVGSVAMVGGAYGVLMSDAMPKKDEKGNTVLTWRDDFRAAYAQRSGTAEVVGSLVPKFMTSMSTGITWKNLSLRVALDARFGGKIASYSNKYGQAYGYTERSLDFRDTEHGGLTWTSNYADSKGMTFHDGVIPEGVFETGTIVTGVDGKQHNVGGQSFAQLVKDGVLEPVHASAWHYWTNAWGTGTVNDYWLEDLNYIALREITLGYRIPKNISSKLGAKGLNVSFSARNLGYLYNSLSNNLNPEGVRSNKAAEFRERSNTPITSSYMLTINMDF